MNLQSESEFLRAFGWAHFLANVSESSEKQTLSEILSEIDANGLTLARIVGQERSLYRAQISNDEVCPALIMKRSRKNQPAPEDLPAVGDWVACKKQGSELEIRRLLPRYSTLKRLRPTNKAVVQLMATNVDYVLLALSLQTVLEGSLDLSRIQRYLEICRESNATPILVLTKSDLISDRTQIETTLASEFPNLKYEFVTQDDEASLSALKIYFASGKTSVLIGSSGVGKSTLFNFLVGNERQKTQEVSNDAKGRHTTTSRTLTRTIWDGLVIDTPGMMDVLSTAEDESEEENFADIEELALTCKFTNCEHGSEKGCAIQRSLNDQSLDRTHWEKYQAHLAHEAMMRKRRGR